MSIENFYLYESNNKTDYYTEEVDNSNNGTVKGDILYCFYQIIAKHCSELNVFNEPIELFNNEFFLFVSMDSVTGK
ncbi:hypothetical protein [Sporosarcina sp. 6E9]|uniref:hypothetical protein n=1 Tax=Sporosarcina sp. 6E9 TaxID=2819235 RepID=UPI001B30C810|nr:hypothetical protein [Sporosarcina sp. 6E9]